MSLEQHLLAVELLEKLGVDNIKLEPDHTGKYRYHGWSIPLVSGNGSPPILKRGRISRTTRHHRRSPGNSSASARVPDYRWPSGEHHRA
jgi:hypothetical protein